MPRVPYHYVPPLYINLNTPSMYKGMYNVWTPPIHNYDPPYV